MKVCPLLVRLQSKGGYYLRAATNNDFTVCPPERALRKCTKKVVVFYLFDQGVATVCHSSSFFNGYQVCFMPYSQFPTFALCQIDLTKNHAIAQKSNTLNEKKVEKLVKLSFNQKFCEIFLQVLKISVKPSEFTFSAKFERETHKIKSEKVR